MLKAVIPGDHCDHIVKELSEPSTPWYQQYNTFVNQRGVTVSQRFEVYAHKYSHGSQEDIAVRPNLHRLASFVVDNITQPLSKYFPSLQVWEADEVSAQKYLDTEGHLTWHRDLERHPGVIAICNIVGKAMLGIKHNPKDTSVASLESGDILLLRAPGLYDSDVELRPEHAVMSVKGPNDRISVTLRDNTRPDDPIPNFRYHNWE